MSNSQFQKIFDQEYARLNPEQKTAVDAIEGPVMVIAGAGTGKTQTIALRIGKILLETQINPSNILCLTFTDSAAQNMRNRLLSIIGPDAYSCRIGTFHSFCQSVIKANPEFFLQFFADSEPLDKIEQIQIIRRLIDNLPDNDPLKSPVDTYFYQLAIISSLESLKKENVSPEKLSSLLEEQNIFLQSTAPFYQELKAITAYPKNYSIIAGIIEKIIKEKNISSAYRVKVSSLLKDIDTAKEMKSAFISFYDECQKNYPKQLSLSQIYPQYQSALQTSHRFDFDDMILSVIDVFKSSPSLLSQLQEKYQYILVDEYQDANASQNEIIKLLGHGSERPNIFVVGDDDQSIFRFQGASTENVFNFYQQYNPSLIVLKNNYRSHRLIIDTSQSLINRNQNRIAQKIKNIDKSLISTRQYDPDPINFYTAASAAEENFWIVSKIKSLLSSQVSPAQIAVLCRTNADIDDLLPFLNRQKIEYVKDFGANIFLVPEILQLIDLFRFLINPEDNELLGKVLNYRFININSLDLYKLFHGPKNISQTISSREQLISAGVSKKTVKKIVKFYKKTIRFQKDKLNFPSRELFNLAIRRFKFLHYILKTKNLTLLKQLDRLYTEFKTDLSFDDAVNRLSVYLDDKVPLVSPPLLSETGNCIRLMTVHKAKGLEFEHVFIIKALSSRWENSRGSNKIKLPLGIVASEVTSGSYDEELEENRRLFYVALTRAKNQIYLSYTKTNDQGREQPPSRFIFEIDNKYIQSISPDPEIEKTALQIQFQPSSLKLLDVDLTTYLRYFFENKYRFNITHLNSYLKCPLCFFFNTILKIPKNKTRPLSFGTSVHGALAYLFNLYKKTGRLISLDKFLSVFEDNLKRENLSQIDFIALSAAGRRHLTDYYQFYKNEFNGNCFTEHDFKFYHSHLDKIPITGKIDKIEIIKGRAVNVVDFKTGNPDTKYQELKPDGDYFRQLVFYKILADNSPGFGYQINSGTIDFIQKSQSGKFIRRNFEIRPQDVSRLTALIKDVYAKITSFQFNFSPDCPDKDHLHPLLDKYFKNS